MIRWVSRIKLSVCRRICHFVGDADVGSRGPSPSRRGESLTGAQAPRPQAVRPLERRDALHGARGLAHSLRATGLEITLGYVDVGLFEA